MNNMTRQCLEVLDKVDEDLDRLSSEELNSIYNEDEVSSKIEASEETRNFLIALKRFKGRPEMTETIMQFYDSNADQDVTLMMSFDDIEILELYQEGILPNAKDSVILESLENKTVVLNRGKKTLILAQNFK